MSGGAATTSTRPSRSPRRLHIARAPTLAVCALIWGGVIAANVGAAPGKGGEGYPPHRAGMEISVAGHRCTSGFGVVDSATGSYYALTAGHCGAHGPVRIGGKRVGSLVGSSFICCRLTNSDSSLYTVSRNEISATVAGADRNALFSIAGVSVGIPSTAMPVAGYVENSAIRLGQTVCASGAFGGYTCGTVTDTSYRYRFNSGRRLTGLVCFDVPVSDGDSGGPVFTVRQGEAIAVGLVSIGDRAETCFSTIGNALRAWNVDLLVADGNGFAPASESTQIPGGGGDAIDGRGSVERSRLG